MLAPSEFEKPVDLDPLPSPSMKLRPHHIGIEQVRDALLGNQTPKRLARYLSNNYAHVKDNNSGRALIVDLIGSGGSRDLRVFNEGLRTFFTQLRDLPGDSSIELDMVPDGMCEAACVGRHCLATNFTYNGRDFVDLPQRETGYIEKLMELLQTLGFSQGFDYAAQDRRREVQDLGRQKFIAHRMQMTPVVVDFSSLVVRTGALRLVSSQFGHQLDAL